MKSSAISTPRDPRNSMENFFNLFTAVFLGVGLIMLLIGLTLAYNYFNDSGTFDGEDEWVGILVFTLMGIVFSGVGGGIKYYLAKQKARRELLKRTGRKLRGHVINTYFDTTTSFRSGRDVRYPLIVECEAELSGRKQIFKSEGVWSNKSFTAGQEITIYVDTRDYTSYWVDTGE